MATDARGLTLPPRGRTRPPPGRLRVSHTAKGNAGTHQRSQVTAVDTQTPVSRADSKKSLQTGLKEQLPVTGISGIRDGRTGS